jgi:hypothetical protein
VRTQDAPDATTSSCACKLGYKKKVQCAHVGDVVQTRVKRFDGGTIFLSCLVMPPLHEYVKRTKVPKAVRKASFSQAPIEPESECVVFAILVQLLCFSCMYSHTCRLPS